MASAVASNVHAGPGAAGAMSFGWLGPRLSFGGRDTAVEVEEETKPEPPPAICKDFIDFEFSLGGAAIMLPADELFADGKLLPLRPHAAPAGPAAADGEREVERERRDKALVAEVPPTPERVKALHPAAAEAALDPYVFSPKAPTCSSRWRELLRLRKVQTPQKPSPSASPAAAAATPARASSSSAARSLKLLLLQRNGGRASDLSAAPLLRDSSDSEASLSLASSRFSLSSSSSSGHDHDDFPRHSLDSADATPRPRIRLVRSHPHSSQPHAPLAASAPSPAPAQAPARAAHSPARRRPSPSPPPPSVATVDSPRMNASGKIVFQGLERSSSSPAGSAHSSLRSRSRVMDRSYSAGVRATPVVLNQAEGRGFKAAAPRISPRSGRGKMATALPPLRRTTSLLLFLVLAGPLASAARADLVISRADRRVDLTSHIVRVLTSLKVENAGQNPVSQVLLAFPKIQAKNLAAIRAFGTEGKVKGPSTILPIEVVQPSGAPPELTFFSALLSKPLEKGKTLHLEVLTVFTHSLQPFPEEITQAEAQLVVYQDSAHYLSPYPVKVQTLTIRLPGGRVESYTKHPKAKIVDSELKYGPFEDLPPFSYLPVIVHFENNNPFAVAKEVMREIEISHWGNVQITEHYNIAHGGARLKGEFSRIDYQSRPYIRGVSSFRHLIARLPPRAHSIYYRDEIGNISTSHLWSDSKKTQLEIEPRFPLFGGWQTTFTVGYGLPLQDFVFYSDGKRFLNITFGSPMEEILIEKLIVKVVLPEGSKDIEVSAPFPTKQWQEVKYSHLDIVGRPVVVLEKPDVIPEHNLYFQVYYKFNNISLLREPLMLITGFFLLFVACIVFMRTDMSISKSSPSYLAKLQWDEVQGTVQKIQGIFEQCLAVHDKLEASLRDLSRTGDIQSCKAARKAADAQFKELLKELKPLLTSVQSSPQSYQIWPKVEDLVTKEREMQEKLMTRHSTVVDSFEKKLRGQDVENRIVVQQQKIAALRQEVESLLEYISDI